MMPAQTETVGGVAEHADIIKMIPHRYPFLMIDRVEGIVQYKSAIGVKNVTINEPFFQGHFPDHPVMPGVLIVEAMAQTAGVLVIWSMKQESERAADRDLLVYFMSVESAKFRKPVTPGDVLRIHVETLQGRRNVWKCKSEAYVGDTLVAEAVYSAMIMENKG